MTVAEQRREPSTLEAALAYARQGWRVLPLHSPATDGCTCGKADCPSPAKHPRTGNGLKDASSEEGVIRGWWSRWPDANVGVRTGSVSGIVVVDVDSYHGGDDGLVELEETNGHLPPTLTSHTGGGGRHLVFRHPGGERDVRNRAGLATGVDLRADGGYIVAPPSQHASGGAYVWNRPLADPAPLPGWLSEPKRAATVHPIRPLPPLVGAADHPWVLAALEGELDELSRSPEGTRNHQLNAAAFNLGQLVPHALSESEVADRLLSVALSIGLTESESRSTIRSGLDAGKATPREIPERPAPRQRPESGLHGPASAEPEQPSTLAIRWVDEVFEAPPRQPDVLVHGLLRQGELCVIGAPRAIGKSMLAMNLATLLGRGAGQLADTLKVSRRAKVLYAQGELDEYESYMRWYRMAGSEGPPSGVGETFDRWRLRTVTRRSSSSGRDDGAGWSESDEYVEAVLDGRLEATIAENGIDVLIIDPWAVYFAGKESSNDEVEAALDKLRDITLRRGLAVVIFHHLGKSREAAEPEDLWRGASRLADWASTRVTILPHFSEREAREMNMTRQEARRFVDVFMLRRGEPTPDFAMEIDHRSGWWRAWNPPGRPVEIHLTSADVAARCAEAGGWASIAKAAASLEVGKSKATELIERALVEGDLDEIPTPGKGRSFVPSDAFLEGHVETHVEGQAEVEHEVF